MTLPFPIMDWIDLFWVPVALLALHGTQRWLGALFILLCAVMLRMQTELMIEVGYPTGILPLMESDVFTRGLVTYSILFLPYFGLAIWGKGTQKLFFVAYSMSCFFICLCVSSIVMVL